MYSSQQIKRNIAVAALIVAILLIPLLPVPDFWVTQLNYIGLYAMAALGLVLLTGVGGLTSFGQASFVGIGAYTTAYLTTQLGGSPLMSLGIGLLLTLICAIILGFITLRMSGHYLPLATMAWCLALNNFLANVDGLGKFDGILGIPGLEIFGVNFASQRNLFYLIWLIALVAAWGMFNLLDSRPGRVIRALNGRSSMAEAMGASTFRHKLMIFILAALLASISGWLFAYMQRSVNPTSFGVKFGIEYLIMVVIGGIGHVWGAFLGAAVVKMTEDKLQTLLPDLLNMSGNFEIVVFGILLILVLKYAPRGLWSYASQWFAVVFPLPERQKNWGDASDLPHNTKPEAGSTILEIDGIHKKFGGLVAVKDISFSIKSGEIVGLIGPNGAGKSTTFNLITGLLELTSGSVRFRGKDVSKLRSRDIARLGVARTFQHVKMIPDMTVIENVALGAYSRGKTSTLQALFRLDRIEERQVMKEAERQLKRIGMEDSMFELAGNLALGPQRLMEIARALCSDPTLLLLDEPAAGLRHKEKQALALVLQQLKEEGMSLLLVEHDMDFVMNITDKIVVMQFGNKIMEGSPAEVQASPEVRAAYLGAEK